MTTQKKKGRKPKKRRASRPTLWGMELAPTPPHLRDKKESVEDKAESQVSERPRSRGLALLIVLTMLVLSTTITLEMQFDSRVQLQLAANSRNAIQAEYLARSSLQALVQDYALLRTERPPGLCDSCLWGRTRFRTKRVDYVEHLLEDVGLPEDVVQASPEPCSSCPRLLGRPDERCRVP